MNDKIITHQDQDLPYLALKPTHALRVCTTCWLAANGYDEHETGQDMSDALTEIPDGVEVTVGWTNDQRADAGLAPVDLDAEESSDDLGFSWSPCDGCGSRLGGDRLMLATWETR